jgi:ketosteroid isomerase-like protein
MSTHDLEANKTLVRRFIEALNTRSYAEMEDLFHKDFIWSTAVISDDAPNEFRPMQSKELRGKNLPHEKPRINRDEALRNLANMFKGRYTDAMSDPSATAAAPVIDDEKYHMRLKIHAFTAEGDRVAIEAESHVLNPNGRIYNNFYHYLFRIRDGKLVLFKEYQDTLHLYDYLAE